MKIPLQQASYKLGQFVQQSQLQLAPDAQLLLGTLTRPILRQWLCTSS
jgi:hypothetical protein